MSVQDGKPLIEYGLDDITQINTGNTYSRAITDNLYGINHRQITSAIPINKDQYGLTLFTRPQLNFTKQNLRNERIMIPLLTGDSLSYQRYIRTQLDPRSMVGYDTGYGVVGAQADRVNSCPLTDANQAFIPILTNNLLSISGWPDITVPTFTSEAGIYKDEWGIVDGVVKNYTSYDITATFRNLRGDPITTMFFYWAHYMSSVFEGTLLPYPDYVAGNVIDYNTRIYRLTLDQSKRYVQSIAATGAAIPIADPIASKFDYSSDKPYNDVNAQIAIPFKCYGAIYNDDILIWSFNKTVCSFNQLMKDSKRESTMMKIPYEYLKLFNNRGYCRIEPQTYELEWWIEKTIYENMKIKFDKAIDDLGIGNLFEQAPSRTV